MPILKLAFKGQKVTYFVLFICESDFFVVED